MDKRMFGRAAALAAVLFGIVACGGGGAAPAGATSSPQPVTAQDPPVTLRLGIADTDDRPSAPAARWFVKRVAELSDGNIVIESTFDAGAGTGAGFEIGVAELVKDGKMELGITGSRVWDLAGVTSLRALQAPLLIDTAALALAVAQSNVATRALDGMAPAGVSGLALWPEDLRHLYAFPNCDKDFRTPEGIAGAEISIVPSMVSRDIIKALGGIDSAFTREGGDAEACRLHGAESGSNGIGVPLGDAVQTANVVLFPKYQVIVVNADAFARLSERQQAVIRQAATDTQVEAYSRQPVEAANAQAWCAGGGTVQQASIDELEALKAATASVTLALEQDPLTKELIADIGALKASLGAPLSGTTCGSTVTSSPSVEPSLPPQDTEGFLATAIPDGTYRTEITEADLLARGASAKFADLNAGIKTWTFKGFTFSQEHGGPCEGTYEVVSGSLVFHGCDVDGGRFLWRPEGDGIAILPLFDAGVSAMDRTEISAYFDRVMSKVD